jgi:predicted transcriptional regulator
MGQRIPSLGELEIEVLRLFWREQPCTERRISELVRAERPLSRTTVLKTIQRLEEKGLLVRVPETAPIQYRAAVGRERVVPTLIRRFVERVLGGSAGPLAAYLAESDAEKLSEKDLASLREIARKIGEDDAGTEGTP